MNVYAQCASSLLISQLSSCITSDSVILKWKLLLHSFRTKLEHNNVIAYTK